MNTRLLWIALPALVAGVANAALTVSEGADGTLSILRDGRPFVRTVVAGSAGPEAKHVEKSFETAPDGAKVWNRWSADKVGRFRLEVVQRPDGAVELSLLGEADGLTANRMRELWLEVPQTVLDGKKYRTLGGTGDASGCRKYPFAPQEGTFGADFKELSARWIETDGVLWDFNPFGVAAMRAMGRIVLADKGVLRFGRQVLFTEQRGGYGMIKIILREGRYEDYFKYHSLTGYYYSQRLAGTHVCFGAPKFGTDYTAGDAVHSSKTGFGWIGGVERRTVVGNPSGAYYSHVAGKGAATYRFTGLIDGFHIVTFQVGNFTGTDNAFSVSVNGETLAADVSVAKGKARTISRAFHVRGGTADIRLTGEWIVSGLAVQPLLSDAEDFQARRAFWYAPGYEAASIYRSDYHRPPAPFPVCDETIDMPAPGHETDGAYREPPRPVARANADDPSLAWLKHVEMAWLLNNVSTMAELNDPVCRAKQLDHLKELGCNAAFVSGMLSRHTFPKEMRDHGQKMVATVAKELHERDMKCIDHFDVTLLWNACWGHRTVMERLPETLRARQENLPSTHFCPNNPELKRKVFAYVREQVQNGVDGFQLDEVEFWPHGCTCKWCRERFHEETGWWYPLDETDPAVLGQRTPLQQRWYAWRYQTIANWFVELRAHLKDVNPNVVFSMYNVHWNFMASQFDKMYSTDLLELGRVIDFMGTEVLVQNKIQMGRPLLVMQRLFNVLSKLHGVSIYGIYYNYRNMKSDYFCWGIGNMLGQSSFPGEPTPDPTVPDFRTWGKGPLNMKRVGAEPIAKVALLFARSCRDWDVTGYYAKADLFGLAQELEAMHVPYEFLADEHVNARDLAKYKILCLGVSQSMSDDLIARIKAYAKRGGKVFLCEGCGIKDELGNLRKEGAFERELEDPSSNFVLMPLAKNFHAWQRNYPQTWGFALDKQEQLAFRQTVGRQIRLAGANVWKTQGISDQVYTSLWKEPDGSTVIHFLNGTGAKESFLGVVPKENPNPPFPPLKEDIRFTLPGTVASKVVAASPDFKGEVALETREVGNGEIEVFLPKNLVRVYTLVRISEH